MGSVVEYLAQHESGGSAHAACRATPCVPNSLGRLQEAGQYLRPGEHAGWLGRRYNPLTTVVDKKDLQDNPYWRDCRDEELTFQIEGLAPAEGLRLDRMNRRVSLLDQFDDQRRLMDRVARVRDFDRFRQRALALATSEATRQALDIRREEPRRFATATAATCSASRLWWPAGWSRPESGS